MSDEAHEPVKRLFFALSCPVEQRRAIAQWRNALELRIGRSVPTENFHLTLLFLGAVGAAQIAGICTAAGKVRVPGVALRVALDRLDVWRRAGVLVLAPGTGDDTVREGGNGAGVPAAPDADARIPRAGAGVRYAAGVFPAR